MQWLASCSTGTPLAKWPGRPLKSSTSRRSGKGAGHSRRRHGGSRPRSRRRLPPRSPLTKPG
eukprot:11014140-Alexandrium_andersonii.AAC.1